MAGDWIKIEHATADKPEVGKIAEILGIDHDAALGKVLRFWMWADQQSVSGNAFSVTKSSIDRVTYCPGFADALLEVDWLQARSGSFAIPRFDRHNGQTAKQRAESNRRVAEHRKRKCNDESLPKPLPESEKRRGNTERESRGAPSLKEAIAAGIEAGIPDYVTTVWWEARETNGWRKGTQGGGTTPVINWRTDLSRSRTWAEEEHAKSKKNHSQKTNGYNERTDF